MSKVLIIIPARYESKRLPGKPLLKINGVEMIKRVADIAAYICKINSDCRYVVATDDSRICDFCTQRNITVSMTSALCKSGTERCVEVVQNQAVKPDLIINLQGDNPLCPPWIIQDIIDAWKASKADVYTPYVALNWDEYERLIEIKKNTPASGTTVIIDKNSFALAFSKNIIPAIRKEDEAKKYLPNSPVLRHIGLYAYTCETLQNYLFLEESDAEKSYIEGLEQMRFLYNGLKIKMVRVDYRNRETTSGVDSEADIARVETILNKYGEFNLNI